MAKRDYYELFAKDEDDDMSVMHECDCKYIYSEREREIERRCVICVNCVS